MMGLNERSLKYLVLDSGWDNIQIPNYPFFILILAPRTVVYDWAIAALSHLSFFLPISPQAVINRNPFVTSGLSSRFHLIQTGHAIADT